MNQISFSGVEFATDKSKAWREKYLENMDVSIPWKKLESTTLPHYPTTGKGRHPLLESSIIFNTNQTGLT
jgi:hypothetical protein